MVQALSVGAWLAHRFPAQFAPENEVLKFFFPGEAYRDDMHLDDAPTLPLNLHVRGALIPSFAPCLAKVIGGLAIGSLVSFVIFTLFGLLFSLFLPSLVVTLLQLLMLLGWMIAMFVGPLSAWIDSFMIPTVLVIWTLFVHYVIEPVVCAGAWVSCQGWNPGLAR